MVLTAILYVVELHICKYVLSVKGFVILSFLIHKPDGTARRGHYFLCYVELTQVAQGRYFENVCISPSP